MVRYPAGKDGITPVYCDTVSASRRFALLPDGLARRRFTTEVALGNAWGAIDTAVTYRLPFPSGKKDVTYRLAIRDGWPTHEFLLSPGDTVYAARKGVVVDVKDKKGGPMEITVQHPDGSWASYRNLERGSFMVTPGSKVWPDTPLAAVAVKDGALRLSIKCPVVVEKRGRGRFELADISPTFATLSMACGSGKTYLVTPRVDYELIIQEMTSADVEEIRKALVNN